jgi:hypothetical protein
MRNPVLSMPFDDGKMKKFSVPVTFDGLLFFEILYVVSFLSE